MAARTKAKRPPEPKPYRVQYWHGALKGREWSTGLSTVFGENNRGLKVLAEHSAAAISAVATKFQLKPSDLCAIPYAEADSRTLSNILGQPVRKNATAIKAVLADPLAEKSEAGEIVRCTWVLCEDPAAAISRWGTDTNVEYAVSLADIGKRTVYGDRLDEAVTEFLRLVKELP